MLHTRPDLYIEGPPTPGTIQRNRYQADSGTAPSCRGGFKQNRSDQHFSASPEYCFKLLVVARKTLVRGQKIGAQYYYHVFVVG